MKFLHLSDLHLGRKFYQVSLLPMQKKTLQAVLKYIDENEVEGVFLAGDIYDKGIPFTEAVTVLDTFLTELAKRHVMTFLISGNHDSPERLQFGSSLFESNHIHIAGSFRGTLEKVTVHDAYGPIHIYMLPFVKLAQIACYYPEEKLETLSQAVSYLIQKANITKEERNILIYHGFVLHDMVDPETSDSELYLGGMQLLDASLFSDFDYVALGHIHKPQWVKRNQIRYSGSLMKYSFSESMQIKSMTLLESVDASHFVFSQVPLPVEKDMCVIRGSLEELLNNANVTADFVRAELTDTDILPYASERLREFYPFLMELIYVNQKEEMMKSSVEALHDFHERSMLELLSAFYQEVYGICIEENETEYEILQKLSREMEENQ